MGNENKVNRNLSEVKSRFLPADIEDPNARSEVYALDKEFAAAAKNRSWTFYLITFGFLAAIIAATLVITQLVQGKHNQVELAIMEFEEIKLKDILSATRNDEKSLEVARRELEALRAKYREVLAELKERKASEAEIAKARADYNGKIAVQQKTVADYESKVNKRHREMSEGVAKVENILSNHERLMKLRLDKQEAELIAKYNPVFTEAELRKIVAYERSSGRVQMPALGPFPPELAKEKIIIKDKFEKLRAEQAEEKRLISRLRQVPYINSVAPALTGIDRRNAEITAQYEAIIAELVKSVRRKNEILGNYRAALKELTDREREYGYVIDARNKAKMRVYLNPSLRAKTGLRANIFRKDDEYIADIEIFFDNEGPCAKVIHVAEGKTIGAFDKIYLEDR